MSQVLIHKYVYKLIIMLSYIPVRNVKFASNCLSSEMLLDITTDTDIVSPSVCASSSINVSEISTPNKSSDNFSTYRGHASYRQNPANELLLYLYLQ